MTSYRCHGITRSGERCKRRCDNEGFCSLHPAKGGVVTKTGFAKLQGVDPSMVTKWLSEGVIEETSDGYIEWEKSERAIASARDLSRPLQRHGEIHDKSVVSISDLEDLDADEVRRRHAIAQMREREERAAIAELERMKMEGLLVSTEEVEAEAEDVALKLQAALMAIPDRVSPEVLGKQTVREVHALITKEITRVLESLSAGMIGDLAS